MTYRIRQLGLAGWITSFLFLSGLIAAQAGQVATFQLTPKPGNSGLTIFQADVDPANAVVPSDPASSPVHILDGSTGFNQQNMTVLLGNGTENGATVQQLVLLFGVQPQYDSGGKLTGFQPVLDSGGNADPGLAGNGVVKFSLDLAPDFKGTLNLLPTPTSASSFSLTSLTLPPSSPSSPSTTTSSPSSPVAPVLNVPEPVSVALWLAGMGVGTLRALRFRRHRSMA